MIRFIHSHSNNTDFYCKSWIHHIAFNGLSAVQKECTGGWDGWWSNWYKSTTLSELWDGEDKKAWYVAIQVSKNMITITNINNRNLKGIIFSHTEKPESLQNFLPLVCKDFKFSGWLHKIDRNIWSSKSWVLFTDISKYYSPTCPHCSRC